MRHYVRSEWFVAVLLSMLWVPCVAAQGPPGYGYTPTVADRTEPEAPPYLGNTADDLNLFFPPESASFPRVNPNAKRATVDGRLTLLMNGDLQNGGKIVFKAFSPELLDDQTPLSLETGTPAGEKLSPSLTLASFFPTGYFDTHTELEEPLGPPSGAICDAFPETPKARRYSTSSVQNPRRCDSSDGDDPTEPSPAPLDDEYDCYDIWLVVAFDRKNNHAPQLWSRPLTVAVKNPKTSTATPVLATYTGDPQKSPGLENTNDPYPGNDAEAPAVTADGRLLVMDSTTGGIVYSLNDGTYDPCDARAWSRFGELSEAPSDQDLIDDKYGFTEYPLRDTEGETYTAGDIIRGTYPWIDRSGSNVVWSRVGAINPTVSEGGWEFETNYTMACLDDEIIEDRVLKRIAQAGMSFAGLWSRGKMVHIDGRANLSSYTIVYSELERAVRRGDVCLEPGVSCGDPDPPDCCGTTLGCCSCGNIDAVGGPAINTAAYDALKVRDFGMNVVDLYVDQGSDEVRIGQARNATIWSNENHFNYLPHMRPTETRDIVWSLQTDRNHMDISFDDYLSEGVLINSDMTPSISVVDMDPTPGLENVPYFNDGWEVDHNGDQADGRTVGSNGYSLIPRLQNAATADAPLDGTALVPPAYGSLVNGARIEPVALGGIKGRGVFLDGEDDWIAYELEEDGTPTKEQPWFVSMWINPKLLVDEPCGGGAVGDIRRDLLHFPDGTRVFLNGYDGIIKIKKPGYNVSVGYPGNLSLDSDEWSHLAIQAVPASATTTDLTVYLNGYQIFDSPGESGALFRLEEGTLKVGYDDAVTCKPFKGWIDDFKVIQRQLNPEEVCRHAYGTLVATTDTNDEVASQYPSAAHDVIRGLIGGDEQTIYYCEIAYPEKDAISSDLGERSDSVCVRDVDRYTNPDCIGHLITFPEGQNLYYDAPRPASASTVYTNTFCTSCHTSDESFYTMDPDGPDNDVTSFDGGVLEYDSSVDAQDDVRRQPSQWPRAIHGAIPPGLRMSSSYPLPYDCFTADDGLESRLIDMCFLPSAP